MLILTRRVGESVTIGGSIEVKVLNVQGKSVQLGIEAPKGVAIVRPETGNPGTPTRGAGNRR